MKKRRMWGLFEDDVSSEIGKAIAYSIPISVTLSIFYQKFPAILLYLSGTLDATTIMDVFAHTFATAGIAGFLLAMIKKNAKSGSWFSKNAMLASVLITLVIMIPFWENFEKMLNIMVTEDYLKDIVSDFAGIFSYVGIEAFRNRLNKRLPKKKAI